MGSVVIVFQSRCLTHSSLARNPIMATASADPGFRLTGMTKGLQWNVDVLFPRILQRLVAQLPQSQSDSPPSGVRLNHLVNEALAGRNEGIGEAGFLFRLAEDKSEPKSLIRISYAGSCVNNTNTVHK